MKRLALVAAALLLLVDCGATIRSITGEGTPKCRLKCAWDETCRWAWVECSGPFGLSCSHGEPVCRKTTAAEEGRW